MIKADQQTKRKILQAAEAQFSLFGPAKTSMEDIAMKAGLSRATLYLHFNSKRAVYESLLHSINRKFVSEIELILTSEIIAPKKLRKFVELTATCYQNNPLLFAAVVSDNRFSMGQVAPEIMSHYRGEILGAIQKIIKQGIAEKSLRALKVDQAAYLIYELGTNLLVKELKNEADYPLKNILDVMDDIIANGILQKNE